LSGNFEIAGYVRNLSDGTVEVVAEGEATEIEAFLQAIQREFGGKIRGVTVEPLSSDEALTDFTIRY